MKFQDSTLPYQFRIASVGAKLNAGQCLDHNSPEFEDLGRLAPVNSTDPSKGWVNSQALLLGIEGGIGSDFEVIPIYCMDKERKILLKGTIRWMQISGVYLIVYCISGCCLWMFMCPLDSKPSRVYLDTIHPSVSERALPSRLAEPIDLEKLTLHKFNRRAGLAVPTTDGIASEKITDEIVLLPNRRKHSLPYCCKHIVPQTVDQLVRCTETLCAVPSTAKELFNGSMGKKLGGQIAAVIDQLREFQKLLSV